MKETVIIYALHKDGEWYRGLRTPWGDFVNARFYRNLKSANIAKGKCVGREGCDVEVVACCIVRTKVVG